LSLIIVYVDDLGMMQLGGRKKDRGDAEDNPAADEMIEPTDAAV